MVNGKFALGRKTMPMMYNPEDIKNFIKEEQAQNNARELSNKEEAKKNRELVNKAVSNAQVAFEQSQNNRFEIEVLKKQIKTAKIIAVIAIIAAIICLAVTMIDEINALISLLP